MTVAVPKNFDFFASGSRPYFPGEGNETGGEPPRVGLGSGDRATGGVVLPYHYFPKSPNLLADQKENPR